MRSPVLPGGASPLKPVFPDPGSAFNGHKWPVLFGRSSYSAFLAVHLIRAELVPGGTDVQAFIQFQVGEVLTLYGGCFATAGGASKHYFLFAIQKKITASRP